MTKIKLTQEQAEAIEILRSNKRHNSWDYIAKRKNSDPFKNEYKAFNDMNLNNIIVAFYVGYEVEPQFQVGDWVVVASTQDWVVIEEKEGLHDNLEHRKSGYTFKIAQASADTIGDSERNFYSYKNIRHATQEEIKAEKERQLWKSIGREVGEFRKGDNGLTFHKISSNTMVTNVETLKEKYENGELKGFYPVESFISFESEGE